MTSTVCCTICGALTVDQCTCRMGARYTQNDDPGREMEVAVLREKLATKDAEIAKLKSELDDAKVVARDIFDDWRHGNSFEGEDSYVDLLAWYYEQWPYLRGGEG